MNENETRGLIFILNDVKYWLEGYRKGILDLKSKMSLRCSNTTNALLSSTKVAIQDLDLLIKDLQDEQETKKMANKS